jgi:hypothetical protein
MHLMGLRSIKIHTNGLHSSEYYSILSALQRFPIIVMLTTITAFHCLIPDGVKINRKLIATPSNKSSLWALWGAAGSELSAEPVNELVNEK